MIYSKLSLFTSSHRSITIILRKYSKETYSRFKMPKDNNKHVFELQKQRTKMKVQSVKYTPSIAYLKIIGNGSYDSTRSVLLVTDHTSYLFNCGEGTQRLATEHHAKLTKVEHIFITKPIWENIGGIPGIALTVQDTGVPQVNLHGPKGTSEIIEATSNFITLDKLNVIAADSSVVFNDQTMTVTSVPIQNSKTSELTESIETDLLLDDTNYYDYQVNSNGKRMHSPTSFSNQLLKVKSKRIDSMMAYICKLHSKEGTLDFKKCVEEGVSPGPELKVLKSGGDITLSNGKIVRSKDVCSEPQPGPLFIVLECPDENWIDDIVENTAFTKYQEDNTKNEDLVNYIVHFTPKNVLNNTKYKEWMRKFGKNTLHLIINEENTGYSSEAAHKMQHQLHLLHPSIFPFFHNQQNFANENLNQNMKKCIEDKLNQPNSDPTNNTELEINKNTESNITLQNDDELLIHQCQTLNSVHLRPHKGLEKTCVQINPKQYVQEVLNVDGFLDTLADLQTEINAKENALRNLEEYPRILMLGTGSSIPNKIRNTSGILLQLKEDTSIILDCGEATIGQILRFYGKSEAEQILKSIKAVYVSHLHADHHLGFIGILKERQKVTDEPLFLLAPTQLKSYLTFYNNRFEPIKDLYKLISNRDLLQNQHILSHALSQELYELLDVSDISTIFVTHCPYAYGVAITLKDGRKISYSGDTVPCDNFLKLAQNSFLMIHEATMEDGLEKEAIVKRHSTISQAVTVGLKAEVDFTLLTHFSQRYSKIPLLPNMHGTIDFSRVGIAYDFMMISLSRLPLLPLFYPCLQIMFHEFRALLDERANKREWKKELVKQALK